MTRKALRNVSISHGTLRTEDLIEAFWKVIEEYYPNNNTKACAYVSFGIAKNSPTEGEYDDNMSLHLHEMLFPMMESLAPEGCYFGAHPGDGSDFGFWEADTDQ